MTDTGLQAIIVPKWGMTMQEAKLVEWLVEEGGTVPKGDPIVDLETEKIVNTVESPIDGMLVRKVGQEGAVYACGALIGVVAGDAVETSEVDAFVAKYRTDEVAKAPEGTEENILKISANGGDLEIQRIGTGDNGKVFLHGFGGMRSDWLALTPLLDQSNESFFLVDLPGHGGSTQIDAPTITLDALADRIASAIEKLNVGKVELVGHSLGGGIAVLVAKQRADLVERLSLIAPVGLGEEIDETFITDFSNVRRRKDLKGLIERLYFDAELVTVSAVDSVLNDRRRDGVAQSLHAIGQGMLSSYQESPHFLRDSLRELKVPVQVIWGEGDRIIAPPRGEAFGPSVKVLTLPDVGHLPHIEAASQVSAALRCHDE